jgi:pimeloyl-ACP methyl ester carboxylesterase
MAILASPHVVLPDGRRLAYRAFGPASGRPLLYFHGTPASKHNWYLGHDADALERLGIRAFAIDRPGIGGSDPQPGRTLLAWADDVRAFADALALPSFAVLGYSCGAPYAWACAARLPERVAGVAIASGVVDLTHPDIAALPPRANLQVLRRGAERPRLSRLVYRIMATTAKLVPGPMVRQASASMPEADRATIRDPSVAREFLAMLAETFAQGPFGAQVDSALVASAWGFDPADARVPVRMWHGDADENVPIEMARHLAERVPGAELTVVPGAGHLSFVHRDLAKILSGLDPEGG